MKKNAVVASILLMISIGFVPIVLMSCSNEIPVYTVRFDSQGGNAIEPIEALKNSKLTEPSTPSKTGYEFGGWYKDSSYSERWVFSRDMVRSDMTLYAKWNAHTYAVTYNGNGQSTGTAPPTQTKKHGESLTLSANSGTLQHNGYRFGGWNTQSDGFGTNYASGTLYETDAEILLYAKWIAEEYNVTLNKQGGNSGSDSITATYDSAMPSATAPIKNGYLFDGYYDQGDGGIQYYSSTMESSRIWNKADNTTLYAKWSPAYTVIFNSQEGSSVSSLEGVRQGSRIGEPAAPTRNGYAFDGWFKDSSCVAAWDFDVETINSNTTLYAKWVVAYTVGFDSQGGINIAALGGIRQGSKITAPTAPTRNGYVFQGWYKDSDCTIEWNFNVDIVDSDITLYAKWLVVLYTVNFDSQEGTDVGSVENILYGTKISAPVSPVKNKHVFGGWYRDNSYEQLYYFTTDVVTSSMTLYAKWFPPYTVSFDSQSGSPVAQITGTTHGDVIPEPADPIRSGYIFGGWYRESNLVNSWNFNADTVTSDMTLYAKWVALYTVSFDTQGGNIIAPLEGIRQGSKITEPANPTRDGYTFDGWYRDISCTQLFNFATEVVTSSMTLYAKWVPPHSVSFDSKGGSLVAQITEATHGVVIPEPADPIRSGYAFDGWYRENDLVNSWNFNADTVTSDMTLYAKWIVLHPVSFDSRGGSGVNAIEIGDGRLLTKPADPTRDGYILDGWYKEIACINRWNFNTDTVTAPSTLYAKWNIYPSIGPSGGYVFYDKGAYSDGWRFLEAAPAGWRGTEIDPVFVFGYYRIMMEEDATEVGTETGIGSGKENTQALVAAMGSSAYGTYSGSTTTAEYAAKMCADYRGGGYADWFLPSKDELIQMYQNLYRNNLGGFSGGNYWSSTEYDYFSAWYQNFYNGGQEHNGRGWDNRVRPVRAF